MAVPKIPEGFNTVSVHMTVSDSIQAIEFYKQAFDAELTVHLPGPGGKGTMHAAVRIGNSTVMMADDNPAMGCTSPATLGGIAAEIHLYVDDVDAAFQQAVDAGCEVLMPLDDMFWGDRFGRVKDPFGHVWSLATQIEEVSPEDMEKRQMEWLLAMEKQQTGESLA